MPGLLSSPSPAPDPTTITSTTTTPAADTTTSTPSAPNTTTNIQHLSQDPRIKILPGGSDHAASFEFLNEDHTVGNTLRYMIMKNPDVEFCGYSIPHPAEPKMNLRIQTYDETTVWDALAKGLDDLLDLCTVVETKFVEARNEFMGDGMRD